MKDSLNPPEQTCRQEDAERRAMCQTLFYWLECHVEETIPSHVDLDLKARPELARHLFTLDLNRVAGALTIDFCGSVVTDLCGGNPSGQCASRAFPAPFREQIPHLCKNVAEFRKPISDSGAAYAPQGEIAYRAILMPLSHDKAIIDRILGSITFRPMV